MSETKVSWRHSGMHSRQDMAAICTGQYRRRLSFIGITHVRLAHQLPRKQTAGALPLPLFRLTTIKRADVSL